MANRKKMIVACCCTVALTAVGIGAALWHPWGAGARAEPEKSSR